MVRKRNIRLWSTIFIMVILVLSLSGLSLAKNPLEQILGNQDTMMGNQSTMMGNQSTMMGNQSTMMGNQNTMMGNQNTMMGNQNTMMENQDGMEWRLYRMPPVWSEKIQCDESACPRFEVVLDGEAVLDNETGIVWQRELNTTNQTWYSASSYCIGLISGGRRGWRLATAYELSSLIDPTKSFPAFPSGHPFINLQSAAFWSSTINALNQTGYLVLYMTNGVLTSFPSNDANAKPWCVRGGQCINAPANMSGQ